MPPGDCATSSFSELKHCVTMKLCNHERSRDSPPTASPQKAQACHVPWLMEQFTAATRNSFPWLMLVLKRL